MVRRIPAGSWQLVAGCLPMDIATIRVKNDDELRALLRQEQHRLEDLRFQMRTRELKNVHVIRQTRRRIARVLTVLGERVRV